LQRGCFIQRDGFEAERMGSWKHRSRSRSVAFGTSCPFKCCQTPLGCRAFASGNITTTIGAILEAVVVRGEGLIDGIFEEMRLKIYK